MEFLSIMSKGTTQEKILWSFDFFDIDRNGYIERQEMIKVWNKWKMLHWKQDIFFIVVIVQVLEAVYEMVAPGSNVSQSEVYTQVVIYQYFLALNLKSPCRRRMFSIYIEDLSLFQAEIQFTKMDANQDGIVTKQEFLNYCLNNPTVIESMCVLP